MCSPIRRASTLIALAVCLDALFIPACAGTAPLAPKAVELNRLGADSLAKGDLETAGARFSLALEYHPRFVEALTNLGLVEMQRGNFERARILFERARRINADLAQPHHALGVLAERIARADIAAEHYREALKVNPGFGPSRANLGRMLFAAGRYHDAREQFLRLVEADPGEIQGALGLAETLIRLDRSDESDGVIARAKERFGDTPALLVLVARRELAKGNLDEAEQILSPLARAADDDVGRAAWSWLAAIHLARADYAKAFDAAERALALDKNDAVATYVVAAALCATGDPRAAAWRARSRTLSPQGGAAQNEPCRAEARPH
jgi:tetratricopeptide (TPR) repeat protein